MGMYDEIICHYPLPGDTPDYITPDHRFQTKDTPEQYLKVYTIAEDGQFIGEDDYTGVIEFYTSNSIGCWGPVMYTANGGDVHSVTYVAKIVDGKLASIEQTESEKQAGITSNGRDAIQQLAPPDGYSERYSTDPATMLGMRVWVKYGIGDGWWADVVYEKGDRIVLSAVDDPPPDLADPLTLEDRSAWGRVLWRNAEDSEYQKNKRGAEHDAEKERYANAVEDFNRRHAVVTTD